MARRTSPSRDVQPRPSNGELVGFIEAVEIGAAEMVARWWDGIPAELRAEIMLKFRNPALDLLLRLGRRPHSR